MKSIVLRFLALLIALGALACGPQETAQPRVDTWVGTITSEGSVTTVVNESGSVWGGTARLVEEASIGVEAGAEEYMLGAVGGVFVTDGHVYVLDSQVPIVRSYDLDGLHVGNIGERGQGPGEYMRPAMLSGDNGGLVVLQEDEIRRLMVFSEDGDYVGTWPSENIFCCRWAAVPTGRGTFWTRTRFRDDETRSSTFAVQEHGPDGPIGEAQFPVEPEFEPVEITLDVRGRTIAVGTPFTPGSNWAVTSSGAIVIGSSDRYRFEIQSSDGAVIVVERFWNPVPVVAEEADWQRRFFVSVLHMEAAPPEWTWDGAEMPATKPAFSSLIPVSSGDIWVLRPGEGLRIPDCVEDPLEAGYREAVQARCWRDRPLIDVFDAEGRYLGDIDVPSDLRPGRATLAVRGDQVAGVVEDENGVIMVKLWRLISPDGSTR